MPLTYFTSTTFQLMSLNLLSNLRNKETINCFTNSQLKYEEIKKKQGKVFTSCSGTVLSILYMDKVIAHSDKTLKARDLPNGISTLGNMSLIVTKKYLYKQKMLIGSHLFLL